MYKTSYDIISRNGLVMIDCVKYLKKWGKTKFIAIKHSDEFYPIKMKHFNLVCTDTAFQAPLSTQRLIKSKKLEI